MPKQGIEKQVPNDQRARGKNPEHGEGQANRRNEAQQAGSAAAPAPNPPKGK